MAYLQTASVAILAGFRAGGGAEFKSYTGSTQGNQALNIASSQAESAVWYIACAFAHSGYIHSYGCSRRGNMSTGNSLQNIVNDNATTSPNGGSWSFSRITNANTAIVKNGGNYPGGGYYSVNMWGWDLQ